MEIFGLIFLIVALVLLGVGVVVGLAACLITASLMLAGMISVSAAIGVWRRRPGAAFRALIYQLFPLGGAVAGITASWLASTVFSLHLPAAGLILGGLLGGAAGGLILALLVSWTTERLAALAASFWKKSHALGSHHPARPELDAG